MELLETPPLWKRMLFGEDFFEPSQRVPSQGGGELSQGVPSLVGGGKKQLNSLSIYFQKFNVLFLVLVISIFFALLIMRTKPIINHFFPDGESGDKDSTDSNFEASTKEFLNKRRQKIYRMTFLFIAFIIIMYSAIVVFLLFGFFVFKFFTNDLEAGPAWEYGLSRIAYIFWKYKTDNDDTSLVSFYMLAFVVLIVLYLFYLLYNVFAKSYFENIMYETRYNKNDPEIEDLRQPQKYLYQYASYIVLMFLFGFLLISYDVARDIKVLFLINIVYICLYTIFVIMLFRFHMQRYRLLFFGFLIFFMVLFMSYKYVIEILSEYA